MRSNEEIRAAQEAEVDKRFTSFFLPIGLIAGTIFCVWISVQREQSYEKRGHERLDAIFLTLLEDMFVWLEISLGVGALAGIGVGKLFAFCYSSCKVAFAKEDTHIQMISANSAITIAQNPMHTNELENDSSIHITTNSGIITITQSPMHHGEKSNHYSAGNAGLFSSQNSLEYSNFSEYAVPYDTRLNKV